MAGEHSDTDVLIVTKKLLDYKLNQVLVRKLKKKGISVLIFSSHAFNLDRNHSFIEAAPLETAARTGIVIHGSGKVVARMSDEDLVNGMLIIAVAYNSNWKQMTNRRAITKELLRSSILLFHLDGKINLKGIYTLGHFYYWLLIHGPGGLSNDPIWRYAEKSGLMWEWLDSTLAQEMDTQELEEWSNQLKQRFKKFYYRLSHLKFGPITEASYLLQKDSRILQNIPWAKAEGNRLVMKDQGLQLTINLLKLD